MSRIDSSVESAVLTATSYPGAVHTSVGGVGQNMARAAHYLGADTVLISAIGHDAYGATIKSALEDIGMDTAFLQYPGGESRTAVYNAIHSSDGDLVCAVADMSINGMVSAQQIEIAFKKLDPGVVGLDGNISTLAIANAIVWSRHCRSCVAFEPTSVPKSTSVLNALSFIKRSGTIDDVSGLVHVITPNHLELERIAQIALDLALVENVPLPTAVDELAQTHYTLDASVIRDALTLFPLFPVQIIKLGEKGAAVVSPSPADRTKPIIRHIWPLKPKVVVNSNGAGDSLVGAVLASLSTTGVELTPDGLSIDLHPGKLDNIVLRAQKASIMSLESHLAISDKLSPKVIQED